MKFNINFFKLDSFLENNYGIYDEEEYYLHSAGWGTMAYVHFQIAGATRLQVETVIVSECYFRNNSNLKGGAIYLNKNNDFDLQYVYINNTIFALNEAGDNGAGIEFEKNIQRIQGNITNCFFLNNLAWRKKKYFLKLFFLVGSITTEFNHPDSCIYIQNNFFLQNRADMAAGLNLIHLAGTVVLLKNIFQENIAVTQNHVLIGAGGAFLISGSAITIVYSKENIYIYNEIEYKGKNKKIAKNFPFFRCCCELLWKLNRIRFILFWFLIY